MSEDFDFDLLFPGEFIKAGEFNGKDVTLTIASIELRELPDEKRGKDKTTGKDAVKTRGVVYFKNTKKGLVLNKTNAECMKAMWGRNVALWPEKRVTLYPTMVQFGPEKVLAIRVKGSPDLTEPLEFELKLPRKKPVMVKMLPTGKKGQATQQQAPATEPEDESDDPPVPPL